MEKTLLERVRKLNWVLQESTSGVFSYEDLAAILSKLMDANAYIVGLDGHVLGVYYTIKAESAAIEDPETGTSKMPAEYNEELLKVKSTVMNLKADDAMKIFKYDYDSYDKYHTVIPVYGGSERLGTVILARRDEDFKEDDIILGEYGATVVGLEIRRRMKLAEEEDVRIRKSVTKAIETLSYSEEEAVQQIFSELDGTEGLLVASKIADRSGITRSVIVNALRKLESAGVIESRSLGMKGTHIKILNNKFIDELKKTAY
jgi:transcriptional pleiotropic repressor